MVSSLITSINGNLEGVGPDWADVSVGGVTFRVNVPATLVDQLGKIGDRVRLFTSLQMRADSLTLYGFTAEDARRAFEVLLGINGVGPRVALSVLSRFTADALAVAVASGDTDAFGGVPGVGKKTASRIVLELKGKLDGGLVIHAEAMGDGDIVEALTALGYTVYEAREAASSLAPGDKMPLEDKVRLALQRMGGA
jgi:Holliday junction DNA helicase RuvA